MGAYLVPYFRGVRQGSQHAKHRVHCFSPIGRLLLLFAGNALLRRRESVLKREKSFEEEKEATSANATHGVD
jgi:hypothetical protein